MKFGCNGVFNMTEKGKNFIYLSDCLKTGYKVVMLTESLHL